MLSAHQATIATAQANQFQLLQEQMEEMRRENQEKEEKRENEIQRAHQAEAEKILQLEKETEGLKKQLALQAEQAATERQEQIVRRQRQDHEQVCFS